VARENEDFKLIERAAGVPLAIEPSTGRSGGNWGEPARNIHERSHSPGLLLVSIGAMRRVGAAPMRPMRDAASLPIPNLNATLAPVAEIPEGPSAQRRGRSPRIRTGGNAAQGVVALALPVNGEQGGAIGGPAPCAAFSK